MNSFLRKQTYPDQFANALKKFEDSLNRNSKVILFPQKYLRSVVNQLNSKTKAQIIKKFKNNGIPNDVIERIMGTLSSYSGKIRTKENREKYYNIIMNRPTLERHKKVLKTAANKGKRQILNRYIFGYNEKLYDPNVNENNLNIRKGYNFIAKKALKELQHIKNEARSLENRYIQRVSKTKNKNALNQLKKSYTESKLKLLEKVKEIYTDIEVVTWNLVEDDDSFISVYGQNIKNTLEKTISSYLVHGRYFYNPVYYHPFDLFLPILIRPSSINNIKNNTLRKNLENGFHALNVNKFKPLFNREFDSIVQNSLVNQMNVNF